MKIRITSHARYDLWYYVVFCTEYRKKVFEDKKTQEEIKQLFREIALHYDLEVGEVEVLSDHVHLSITAPPSLPAAGRDCSINSCSYTEECEHEDVVQEV